MWVTGSYYFQIWYLSKYRFDYSPAPKQITSVSFILDENTDETFFENTKNGLLIHVEHELPNLVLESAFLHIKNQRKPLELKQNAILLKLRKRWKYKIEIRFYCNAKVENVTLHEKIDTISSRKEFISKIDPNPLIPRVMKTFYEIY